MATSWGYLPNSGDRRLASINNTGLTAGQFTNLQFTTTPENFISAITETSDASAVYPPTGAQTASYNNVNALTNLTGQAFTYDANGNLTSDGQRNYAWDAESRLVGITYVAQPGKATAFTYDGLSRRTQISSTPAGGGSAVTLSYLWCGTRICQARNGSNAVTRGYYSEGELVPGTPAQPYYYGADQIGSVRRAFASTSSAPAYGYDAYGNALQATAPVTDFGYAGMFFNADSGLYLTQYRAYNPTIGRWLSRDPLGEKSDPVANLYPYVRSNPVKFTDPTGRSAVLGGAICNLVPSLCSSRPNPSDNVCRPDPNAPPLIPPYMQSEGEQPGAGNQAPQPQTPDSNPLDVLQPGGNPIGEPGTSSDIRVLPGGPNPQTTAEDLFKNLTQGGQVVSDPSYPGTRVNMPGGGTIGLRPESKSGGPAIDVNIPGTDISKIHFN